MNQSFETLLQVVQRALCETVLPALDGAEKHVVEQLHLSIAALGLMQARLSSARSFKRRGLEDDAALAREVAGLVEHGGGAAGTSLRAAADAAATLLQDPAADDAEYVTAARGLREQVAGTVEASAGQPWEAELDRYVFAGETRRQLRARAWCEPLGFELTPLSADARDW